MLLPQVVRLAEAAGEIVMNEYRRLGTSGPEVLAIKDDASPLTAADLASHRLLGAGLAALEPSYPILSEEGASVPYEERARWERLWLVDPLDGTKEFLTRNGEFTINVALIERNVPVLGVVHAPALGKTYWATRSDGAFLRDGATAVRRIGVADYRKAARITVVVSRSHAGPTTDAFIAAIGNCEHKAVGSALKLCKVAEGSAHLYPRFGTTMEWDVAAAHCVVREAGGTITDLGGRELRYNKPDLRNPFFIVAGNPPFPWQPLLTDKFRRDAGL